MECVDNTCILVGCFAYASTLQPAYRHFLSLALLANRTCVSEIIFCQHNYVPSHNYFGPVVIIGTKEKILWVLILLLGRKGKKEN
jgi:hypothetical protein